MDFSFNFSSIWSRYPVQLSVIRTEVFDNKRRTKRWRRGNIIIETQVITLHHLLLVSLLHISKILNSGFSCKKKNEAVKQHLIAGFTVISILKAISCFQRIDYALVSFCAVVLHFLSKARIFCKRPNYPRVLFMPILEIDYDLVLNRMETDVRNGLCTRTTAQ